MARHPSTEGNDLEPNSVTAEEYVDTPETRGNRYDVKQRDIWNGTKDSNNPIISPSDNDNASSEQYSPGIAVDPNDQDIVWMYVKSDEGSNTVLRLWKSTDGGKSFSMQSTTFEASDSNLTIDEVRNPVLVYDPNKSSWYLWYRGEGNTDGESIGRASGSDPESLTDDGNNPILTENDIQTDLNSAAAKDPRLRDLVKKDGTWLFYGTFSTGNSNLNENFVFLAEGESIDDNQLEVQHIIAGTTDIPRSGEKFSVGGVVRQNGVYYMTVMVGTGDSGEDKAETYVLIGDGRTFKPVVGTFVDTGSTNDWDERWAYAGNWLKKQGYGDQGDNSSGDNGFDRLDRRNDKARFYYNGQSTSNSENGSIGIIEFDELPSPTSLTPIRQQVIPIIRSQTDIQNETVNNTISERFLIPPGTPVAMLESQMERTGGNSEDTAHHAIKITNGGGGDSTNGLLEVSAKGTAYTRRSSMTKLQGRSNGQAEVWAEDPSDDSTPTARIYASSLRVYSAVVRGDGTVR